MRFQVPQFTDVQTKIIGPFTLNQFAWIAIGGLLFVFIQFFLDGTPLIIAMAIIAAISIAFAYAKVGNATLPRYLLMGIVYFFSQKKYTYSKEQEPRGQ